MFGIQLLAVMVVVVLVKVAAVVLCLEYSCWQ